MYIVRIHTKAPTYIVKLAKTKKEALALYDKFQKAYRYPVDMAKVKDQDALLTEALKTIHPNDYSRLTEPHEPETRKANRNPDGDARASEPATGGGDDFDSFDV